VEAPKKRSGEGIRLISEDRVHGSNVLGLEDSGAELGFEDGSFENLVLHYKRALIRLNAGASSRKVLSKRDREHMRHLGAIVLTYSGGRRYVLSDKAKQILGILE
jgi:hypothetical protein